METIATFIIVAFLFASAIVALVLEFRRDPLRIYEPISDEEMLLLTFVDEEFYEPLIKYLRTLEMSSELQDFLKDKKPALEAISYYMLISSAREEQRKRDKWEQQRIEPRDNSKLSHTEKMILNRIKNSPLANTDGKGIL